MGAPVGASLATPAGAGKRRPYKTEGYAEKVFSITKETAICERIRRVRNAGVQVDVEQVK